PRELSSITQCRTHISYSTHTPAPLDSFYYTTTHHQDLHSFPTRRSSDLGFPSPVPVSDRVGPRLSARGDADGRPGLGGALSQPRDRKSTRLNSSHVSISYAVFCLKKKNKSIMFFLV